MSHRSNPRSVHGGGRSGWRTVALDGALLSFDRRSGIAVVSDGEETRALVQRAPRVVQMGITNICNLACHFCSRDLGAESRWTQESAFELLSALAAAGTLEVAFGGGEPFAFRGFVALCERLHAETALAVSVTTNGTLLDAPTLARLAPVLGQLRLSLHDDANWRATLPRLAASGVRFGVNLLVTPARLPVLETMVLDAVSSGARDILLLGYHGPDPLLHLSAAQDRQLARAIRLLSQASRVRFARDVCFGDRLPDLPHANLGLQRADCGAGRDFVVITSDKRLFACSFHSEGLPIASADDVLALFASERARLASPVRARGCARDDARRRLAVLPASATR